MTITDKISYFKSLLAFQEGGYRQEIKHEIYEYYFELENGQFYFLHKLNNEQDIETSLDLVIHKLIIHEHEDGLRNIMDEYFS